MSDAAQFAIIGAGGWGTALAIVTNRSGSKVTIWTRNENIHSVITNKRVNETYLPDVFIDPDIEITTDLRQVCKYSEYVVITVPSQHVRPVCISLSDQLPSGVPVVIASKGIERGSLSLMSEVVSSILPANPVMVLSGPNFAHEVAIGLPSATVIAGKNRTLTEKVIYAMGGKFFRPYYTDDVVGVQIGGAVKNVIAIACGICTGKGLGENARSAIITRGLLEMSRLAEVKGGKPETLAGLAGLGDLILSASSLTSRNMALGYAIGKGEKVAALMPGKRGVLAEGVATSESVYQLSRKLGVSMPICTIVHEVLEGLTEVDHAIEMLLARPLVLE